MKKLIPYRLVQIFILLTLLVYISGGSVAYANKLQIPQTATYSNYVNTSMARGYSYNNFPNSYQGNCSFVSEMVNPSVDINVIGWRLAKCTSGCRNDSTGQYFEIVANNRAPAYITNYYTYGGVITNNNISCPTGYSRTLFTQSRHDFNDTRAPAPWAPYTEY